MDLATVFQERRRLANRRQSRHAKTLALWEQTLGDLSLEHPYNLTPTEFDRFKSKKGFVGESTGYRCVPSGRHLYRLAGTGAVVDFTEWGSRIDVYESKSRIHRALLNDRSREGPWLRLRDYSAGALRGRRGFTWWTSLDTFPMDYRRAASRCGLPNDLLPPLPLVLRVPIDRVKRKVIATIPSTTDAFDLPIFDVTPDEPRPSSGTTITLENTNWLARGCDEYLLGSVPVELIDMLPVEEPASPPPFGLRRGPLLWRLLIAYHSQQEQP